MQFTKRCSLLLGVLFMALLTGCASVQMASMEADTKAKTFEVSKDKANIYVFRNENYGAAVPMTVALDGKVAGQTAAMTYFLFEVNPGSHEVSSIAENNSAITLNAEAGKTYYVWQEVKMGLWMARSRLQQVDEPVGRKAVGECKRAQSSL